MMFITIYGLNWRKVVELGHEYDQKLFKRRFRFDSRKCVLSDRTDGTLHVSSELKPGQNVSSLLQTNKQTNKQMFIGLWQPKKL